NALGSKRRVLAVTEPDKNYYVEDQHVTFCDVYFIPDDYDESQPVRDGMESTIGGPVRRVDPTMIQWSIEQRTRYQTEIEMTAKGWKRWLGTWVSPEQYAQNEKYQEEQGEAARRRADCR